MNFLKGKKKFGLTVVTIVGIVLLDVFGLDLQRDTLFAVVGSLGTYLGVQGVGDMIERAKTIAQPVSDMVEPAKSIVKSAKTVKKAVK